MEIRLRQKRKRARERNIAVALGDIYWTAPGAQPCAECFSTLQSLNPPNSSRRMKRLYCPLPTQGKGVLEESNVHTDTRRVSGRVRTNSHKTKAVGVFIREH